jgi:hypothetical protein
MSTNDCLISGETINLSTTAIVMNDKSFQAMLVGKSSNTTVPYMRRAKELIIRGLLARGTDARRLNGDAELIGGTYRTTCGVVQGRVFLVRGQIATLLWVGPNGDFRDAWMRIRDEHVGRVPYRLYGRAASAQKGAGVRRLNNAKTPKQHICSNYTPAGSRARGDSPFAVRSAQEIDSILGAYRTLFPQRSDPCMRRYLDLDRHRAWSLLTTDFHRATRAMIESFHSDREKVQLEGLPPWKAGRLLQQLYREHPIVGGSLGISPWTDEILLCTFGPNSKRVWAIIGHDWYPVIPKSAVKNDLIGPGCAFLVEARSPKWKYPLYEDNPCIDNTSYRWALPQAPPSDVCLLFMNLVPDLRPPDMKVEGPFPFLDTCLDYPKCVEGSLKLLASLSPDVELSGVVCWGACVRDRISQYAGIRPEQLQEGLCMPIGRFKPFVLACLHPAARPKDFRGRKDSYYNRCWSTIASHA